MHERTRDHYLLLLTDFDGTLSDLVPVPADARVSDAVAAEVDAAIRMPRLTFGVISGRRVADVHERLGRAAEYMAGLHGLEIDGPGGARFRHEALTAAAPIVAAILDEARQALAWCPGLLLEDKTYSMTCHVRGVPEPAATRALDQFMAIAQPHVDSRRFKLQPGSAALELMPQTDWNKGRALEWIRAHVMAQVSQPVAVIYLGDDRTDEDAFRALNDGDAAIGVGERPHDGMIDWRLAGPDSVGRFLGHLRRLRHA